MEYVFGTKADVEILKTKGEIHSDLKGFHSVERVYPDQTITDTFRIIGKLDSKEDAEGNCYDWYGIDRHYRVVDKTGPLAELMAESAAATENALCEQDTAVNARMTAIEDAVCELDALINQTEEETANG